MTHMLPTDFLPGGYPPARRGSGDARTTASLPPILVAAGSSSTADDLRERAPKHRTVRSPRQTASTGNIGSRTGERVSESPTEFDQTFNPPDSLYPLVLTAIKCGFSTANASFDSLAGCRPQDRAMADTSRVHAFRTAVKRAGLNLTLHDLRPVYFKLVRENGVSLETAMALTGHRSVTTVMKYYREVSQIDLASAVKSIDVPAALEAQEKSS